MFVTAACQTPISFDNVSVDMVFYYSGVCFLVFSGLPWHSSTLGGPRAADSHCIAFLLFWTRPERQPVDPASRAGVLEKKKPRPVLELPSREQLHNSQSCNQSSMET